ncbi:MAG: bifunctional anthranilate synthase component II/anthranilate phosphoribosyltransferase [Acidobacteria bacterium]|nr:bifunctional anthranilate synthase component II/anthranilate phosphoribosyltransferase [Acidobacteriota bacterium]
MILLVDNYDSFTFNLYQYLGELGAEVKVIRNDAMSVEAALALDPEKIVVSPGPGTPVQAGISVELIRSAPVPVLGVCLGHQSLAQAFGAEIVRAPTLMHGKTSEIRHDGRTIFTGLPDPFTATRYHSLAVAPESVPGCLEVSAWADGGVIMGLRHRDRPLEGVQFHPESILTGSGKDLLRNFLGLGARVSIKRHLAKLARGEPLTEEEAASAMGTIMEGQATPAQIGALLAAMAARGESEDEIVGFARTMRDRAVPLSSRGAVDTCGTGGDGAGTFNISTVASIVVAACGVPVAKHGNRSASGTCGSADVLEALGVRIDAPAPVVQKALDEAGWTFLFAPKFHAATRHAVGPRKELGVRTAFNLLGPLTNPARPEGQVVGVPKPELTELVARCLHRLGAKKAWVVHGGGLDELALGGPTTVTEVDGESLRTFTVTPEEAGLASAGVETLKGGGPEDNAAIAREVLAGVAGPRRDVVLLNAAAALVVAGRAASLRDGVEQAAAAIDDGRARAQLDRLREVLA